MCGRSSQASCSQSSGVRGRVGVRVLGVLSSIRGLMCN
jgi:hypothetical protein